MKSREVLGAQVAALAHKLISTYAWRSIDHATLVARVMNWIEAGAATKGAYALERLCEQAAAEQLYDACIRGAREEGVVSPLSEEEKEQLQLAYMDLANFLTAAARRLRRSIAPDTTREELVQNALITIYARIKEQDDPRSLLAWAITVLEYKRRESWRDWYARNKHIQPPDDNGPESGNLIADEPKLERGRSYQSVDPEGDEEFFRILGECLHNDEERLLVFGYMLGLKRRELLLVFDTLKGKFDNTRTALIRRLEQCCRFQMLFDLVKSPLQVCTAPRCPLHGAGGRS